MKIFLKSIGGVVLIFLLHIYFFKSEYIEKLDYAIYDTIDWINAYIKEEKDSFYTVVVDIDEKSLQSLGQWPWPRVIDTQLVEQLRLMDPTAIGINVLFPEEDRVSPLYLQQFYRNFFDLNISFKGLPKNLEDNDKLFSNVLNRSGATLATYFKKGSVTDKHCQELSYKNNIFYTIKTNFNATALLCNHKILQDGVENFGFINASIDSDGVLRRIPLFMKYNQQTFPSFALATLLSFDDTITINREEDTILLRFSKKKPKVISVIDILQGTISANELRGKIVVIGSSVIGLYPTYLTSHGEKISNGMVHAFAIDNLLSNDFLIQPEYYKQVTIIVSFLLSLVMIYLLFNKMYLYMGLLFLLTSSISIVWMVYFYMSGVYISIGYLWVPLFFVSFISLVYHTKEIRREKKQQDSVLVKQSKLASMGEMIALIAHQWRQPLSTINGIVLNIDIDHRKGDLNSENLDHLLNQIEERTAYLSKTISDFTEFFSQNKRRDTFYIKEIIVKAKQLTVSENVIIVYKDLKTIQFTGYKSELIQSLLILLNNAIYACQKNMESIESGVINIESSLTNNRLKLTIEDNGGGVDTKDLKTIFNPYFTTKDAQHGTGLGLYILKLIVEDSMNGKVYVNNGKKGAIFTLEIPMLNK